MRRITMLVPVLAIAALAGSATPAAATTRRCDFLNITFCATASASFSEAGSCAAPLPGSEATCSAHSGTGYAFLVNCSGSGDGPAYVQIFGCGGQVAGSVLAATISESHWAWSAQFSMCYAVTVDVIFNDSIFVQVEDDVCW